MNKYLLLLLLVSPSWAMEPVTELTTKDGFIKCWYENDRHYYRIVDSHNDAVVYVQDGRFKEEAMPFFIHYGIPESHIRNCTWNAFIKAVKYTHQGFYNPCLTCLYNPLEEYLSLC